MAKSILKEKSYEFAIKVVRLSQVLQAEKKEFVITKQFLRSGTAIGALLREAEFGQSRPDFIHKMSISLKEANETEYWISLLKDTGYLEEKYVSGFTFQLQRINRVVGCIHQNGQTKFIVKNEK